MAEILLPTKEYNQSLLDAELRAALPNICHGTVRRKGKMWAVLADNAPAGSEATANGVASVHDGSALTPIEQTREQIKTLAQSAVGVNVEQLTAAQVRALFAFVLWKEGAIDVEGTVKPLKEWAR